jgi:hypothetical protein
MCVQVHGEDGVGVGIDVDGAIIIIVLGDRDPLDSDELLFQVMGEGLLLLPSEGGGTLVRPEPRPGSCVQQSRWRRKSPALGAQ